MNDADQHQYQYQYHFLLMNYLLLMSKSLFLFDLSDLGQPFPHLSLILPLMSLHSISLLFIYVSFKYYSTTNPNNNVIDTKIVVV